MYFCTPTFDPYQGLAQTLQAAYPRPQAVEREAADAKPQAASLPTVQAGSANSGKLLSVAA